MRPKVTFLEKALIEKIISEARDILEKLGVEIHNENVLSMLHDHGAQIDREKNRAHLSGSLIDSCLDSSPGSIMLYDSLGREAVDLSGDNVNYTPGSAAIYFLDNQTNERRRPTTSDYIDYVKLVSGMQYIRSQSTSMIPSDVHEQISDSYRLYLSLMYCTKPVVTGAFSIEGFEVMKDMQVAVRGSEAELAAKPLTIFSCCPTSPLKWSDVTSQNVVDCARLSIPVEFIAMPLTGFVAPVTLVGTLVQHTAETLSGVVISQLAEPGAPMLYGGSPAVFDIRYETTPMGDIGTMMTDCAYNEIGKHLGLPTQAYIGLSDSKMLDAQAGLESSLGISLAALAGINNVSGPGMLEFENMFSLEKLVLDNEICGMVYRMLDGIQPKEDFPALPRFEELLKDEHLLISDHTRKYLKEEIFLPGAVIDRATRPRWEEEGRKNLRERANSEVQRIIAAHQPVGLDDSVTKHLTELMQSRAKQCGMDGLPEIG